MSIAADAPQTKGRGRRPTAATLRTGQAYPRARGGQKAGPRRMTGSCLVEPRGARSAFAGWDLGRNDHTDEVGRGRPAELDESLRHF